MPIEVYVYLKGIFNSINKGISGTVGINNQINMVSKYFVLIGIRALQ